MFSSALKSFTSNITSNYTISSSPTSYSGPWKIYDAKKKSTGKAVSVFVFERKVLESQSGLGRSGGPSLKKAHDEVIERLKKEAGSLAKLRHPSILELVEPVEETRNGGLMFATELVTASLAVLLAEKDVREKAGGGGGRVSRSVTEQGEGGSRRKTEVEVDDLEIQRGLLQIAKGLEFLHESAGLVHGNLNPDAIYINAKSDWKVSGLGFCGPPDNSTTQSASVPPISLSDILNYDPRLPRFVQLNLDYSSPDFVLDSNVTTSADLFSLGLLIVALFNAPHTSPLQTNSSPSAYRRLFSSSSTTPSPKNQFLSSSPLPRDLVSAVLPRLITRRPVDRLTARELQQSQFFDNILVSTIRFLDSLPAKTPNEKSQFMRGLPRVLPQFPISVLEKKVLSALLEEMKDRDLLLLTLQNVFAIVKILPSGRRTFTEMVIPRLREVFLTGSGASNAKGGPPERDLGKEAGLMVIVENAGTMAENCSGKDFKDDILPILLMGMESPTHALVDASLRSLPTILPVLDYSTIKNELFPVVGSVFSKTNSLAIKVRGLEAFYVLCGGTEEEELAGQGRKELNGASGAGSQKPGSSPFLFERYTVQEKLFPLIKGIKTKEPAVMMSALKVLRRVGFIADTDFVALELLPLLWSLSLGPLLNLEQFQKFMNLIKSLSKHVEEEQIRKLQELSTSSTNDSRRGRTDDPMSFGAFAASSSNGVSSSGADDFERLVSGQKNSGGHDNADKSAAIFSWSTSSAAAQPAKTLPAPQQPSTFRTITPDLSGFTSLMPSTGPNTQATPSIMQPLQPQPQPQPQNSTAGTWSSAFPNQSTGWSGQRSSPSGSSIPTTVNSSLNIPSMQPLNPSSSAFSISSSLQSSSNQLSSNSQRQPLASSSPFAIPPPPAGRGVSNFGSNGGRVGGLNLKPAAPAGSPSTQKSGLDKYESLL